MEYFSQYSQHTADFLGDMKQNIYFQSDGNWLILPVYVGFFTFHFYFMCADVMVWSFDLTGHRERIGFLYCEYESNCTFSFFPIVGSNVKAYFGNLDISSTDSKPFVFLACYHIRTDFVGQYVFQYVVVSLEKLRIFGRIRVGRFSNRKKEGTLSPDRFNPVFCLGMEFLVFESALR